jgi:protein-tyrosine-phosphatase
LPVTELLVLCTGNAARSVMAGFMLEYLNEHREDKEHGEDTKINPRPDLHIVTAGTHTIDGQPMGLRTRNALSTLPEMAHATFTGHRSRQVYEADLSRADLVVVMEADHVRYVRRVFPLVAPRTAAIRRLCADLPPAPPALGDRLAALNLAEATLSDDDDVIDPAGHDAQAYEACVAELWGLCQQLITLL